MRKALRKTGILAFILAVYFSLSVAAAQMVSLEASTDGVAVQLSGVTENVSTMKSKHSRAYAARLHLILMEALQAKCRNTAMMRKQVF